LLREAPKNRKVLRFYKNLIPPIWQTARAILQEGAHAHRSIQQLLRSNKKWGSRDRRFVAEQIYELIRWYRLYYEVALERPPETEADWWLMLKTAWLLQGHQPPEDWPEMQGLDSLEIWRRHRIAVENRAIRESIPDWLEERALEEVGEERWAKLLPALNSSADVVLRSNSLKAPRQKVLHRLRKEGLPVELLGDREALVLGQNRKFTHLKSYEEGWFEVQDYASQQLAHFLKPQAGRYLVDACAGAGGKSLHLAALMKNRGEILSMDLSEHKLKELRKRAKRAGVSIIKTEKIPASGRFSPAYYNLADYLVLDVPCSGLGVLRRNPQTKWIIKPEFLEEIQATQAHILREYSLLCKPGGQLLYATCSILPSENEWQVQRFLKSPDGQEFELLKEQHLGPDRGPEDGFYMALLQRKG